MLPSHCGKSRAMCIPGRMLAVLECIIMFHENRYDSIVVMWVWRPVKMTPRMGMSSCAPTHASLRILPRRLSGKAWVYLETKNGR